ncbi:MAG: MarR family transcriptional regulator [Nocardioides sp.]|uniref:GbsR/MarR family transcriptional regulator n=1 Tax=Nocardioides sp. TaxID=35761 RepID=UPI003263D2B4
MPRDAAEKYVERMGAALTSAGLARLPSRVFAALTVDPDGRMTSAELVETLGVSPAAVSGAIGSLSQIGFVHRERERGSRRDIYVVDDDAWHRAMMQHDATYAPMLAALDDAIDVLPPGTPEHRRLFVMREFLRFVGTELDAIGERWAVRLAEIDAGLTRS